MIKYYVLEFQSEHFKGEYYYDLLSIEDLNTEKISPLFLSSKELDLVNVTLNFNYVFDKFSNSVLLSSNKSWPVFSTSLINIIQNHDHNCTFVKTNINFPDGKKIVNEYYGVAIPREKNIVDKINSEYVATRRNPETFSLVSKIVLNKNIKLPCIFRIFEFSQIIIINSTIKDEIENIENHGTIIIPLEEYNSFMS